jgi:hypothetical protein
VLLAKRRGFVEKRVERAVLLLSLLDEMEFLAVFVADPGDPEGGQQPELHDPLAFHQRLEGNPGAAEEVVVSPDYRFDVVAARQKQPPLLRGAGLVRFQLRQEVLGIPDPVVHPPAVAIDECHFLRGIELRNRAGADAHVEAQVFVGGAGHVNVEKHRVFRVVDGRENIGVHVVDEVVFENGLGEAFRQLVAVAHPVPPALEDVGGFRRRIGLARQEGHPLLIERAAETEHRFGEVLLGGFAAAAPDKLLLVDVQHGLQREVALADEHGAGLVAVDESQHGEGSRLQLEGADVDRQGEVFAAVGVPETEVAQLPVDGVGIEKGLALFVHADAGLLRGKDQEDLEVPGAREVDGGGVLLKALLGHPHGIFAGCEIRRGELSRAVRGENERLGKGAARNLNLRSRDDRTARILHGTGERVGAEPLRKEHGQRNHRRKNARESREKRRRSQSRARSRVSHQRPAGHGHQGLPVSAGRPRPHQVPRNRGPEEENRATGVY